MQPLKMPHLALGEEALKIVAWLKEPGEAFAIGEPLLEAESSKATMEVEAPFAGVLAGYVRDEGDEVDPGDVIAWCVEVGEEVDQDALRVLLGGGGPAGATGDALGVDAAAEAAAAPAADRDPAMAGDGQTATATVATARQSWLALAEGGDLGGLAVAARQVAPTTRAAATPVLPDGARTTPIRGRRAAIAHQTRRAVDVPQFAVTRELEIPDGMRALSDALVLAAARAATCQPRLNAWVLDDEIVELRDVDVAFAVDCPEGVVAPVIRAVQTLTLDELARQRREVVQRAQEGALKQSELADASITVSNIGAVGGDSVTPVLTVPQAMALGLGRSRRGPSGTVLTATVVADHRAVDGADGARFLVALAEELTAIAGSQAAA
jgi:pyruvate dehydrogenase E2 component (dihydrolipoyllysine-residue acetyltransferase)